MSEPASQASLSVLYLSNADPTASGGGYRRMFEEAKRLADRGHQTTILASRTDPNLPADRCVDGVRIRTVKCVPDRLSRFPIPFYYLSRSLFPLVSVPTLIQLLATHSYDLVVDNCSPHPSLAGFVGSMFATPVVALVHEYHDTTALTKYNAVVGLIQLAAQQLLRGRWYDGVIVPRETTRAQLRAYGVRSPIHVVPNGIEIDRYRRSYPTLPGELCNPPDVVTVSRLVRRKGIDRLIDAVDQLVVDRPGLTVAIAGDGPERDRLESLVAHRDLDESVVFLGYIPEHQKLQLLDTGSVFVFPSRQEGFGIAVLEAMAMGTPVVVNDIQILRALVPDRGNAFADAANPTEFAAALDRLLALSPPERAEIGASNHREAQTYRWERIVDDIERIYSSIHR